MLDTRGKQEIMLGRERLLGIFLSLIFSVSIATAQTTVTTTGGTATSVPVFSGTSTIIPSNITQLSTGLVGINTASPAFQLEVNGDINLLSGAAYRYAGTPVVTAQPLLQNFYFGHSGNLTGTGFGNVAIGEGAFLMNTTGQDNVAVGNNAFAANTTGSGGTAIGVGTLSANTSGQLNQAFGGDALAYNSTGGLNVAVGYQTLLNNTSGSNNVAFGNYAGSNNTTGQYQFFLSEIGQSSLDNDKKYSLMYGNFSPTAGSLIGQQLTVNGLFNVNGSLLTASLNRIATAVGTGCDPTGVTDSTACIQAMFDSPGETVEIPAGTFLVGSTGPLYLPSNKTIRGQGEVVTTLLSSNGMTFDIDSWSFDSTTDILTFTLHTSPIPYLGTANWGCTDGTYSHGGFSAVFGYGLQNTADAFSFSNTSLNGATASSAATSSSSGYPDCLPDAGAVTFTSSLLGAVPTSSLSCSTACGTWSLTTNMMQVYDVRPSTPTVATNLTVRDMTLTGNSSPSLPTGVVPHFGSPLLALATPDFVAYDAHDSFLDLEIRDFQSYPIQFGANYLLFENIHFSNIGSNDFDGICSSNLTFRNIISTGTGWNTDPLTSPGYLTAINMNTSCAGGNVLIDNYLFSPDPTSTNTPYVFGFVGSAVHGDNYPYSGITISNSTFNFPKPAAFFTGWANNLRLINNIAPNLGGVEIGGNHLKLIGNSNLFFVQALTGLIANSDPAETVTAEDDIEIASNSLIFQTDMPTAGGGITFAQFSGFQGFPAGCIDVVQNCGGPPPTHIANLSLSRSGGVVTVRTYTPHGLSAGGTTYINGVSYGGGVWQLSIASAGSGQTPGTYTVAGAGGGGSKATAIITVDLGGTVTAAPVILDPGYGYTSAPTFTLAAGGTPATFTASLQTTFNSPSGSPTTVASVIDAYTFTYAQTGESATWPPPCSYSHINIHDNLLVTHYVSGSDSNVSRFAEIGEGEGTSNCTYANTTIHHNQMTNNGTKPGDSSHADSMIVLNIPTTSTGLFADHNVDTSVNQGTGALNINHLITAPGTNVANVRFDSEQTDNTSMVLDNSGGTQPAIRFTNSTVAGTFYPGTPGTPSVAAGPAAGTSPTIAVAGNNNYGTISVTTGTSPTSNAVLFTTTFSSVLPSAAKQCTLQPTNSASAGVPLFTSAPTTTFWTANVGSTALAASTAYTWGFSCN